MGQKYRRMEDQKLGVLVVRKQNVAKRGGLEPKVNVFQICVNLWRHGEKTNLPQTYHRRKCLGRGFQLPETMCDCLEIFVILAILKLFGSHFSRF